MMGLFPDLESLPDPWPDWFTPGKNTPAVHMDRVRAGYHPSGAHLSEDPSTRCGTCQSLVRRQPTGARTYLKCDKVTWTRGPATDMRAKWRGCLYWTEKRDA